MAQLNPALRGLQKLVTTHADNATLGGLAAKDAVAVDATYNGLDNPFLLKRWRMIGVLTDSGSDLATVMFYIAASGANAAETEVAIEELRTSNVRDSTTWVASMRSNVVIWNSIYTVEPPAVNGAASDKQIFDTGWITCGKKGKGIPYAETFGPEIHAYNYGGAALQAALMLNGVIILEGVFLNE